MRLPRTIRIASGQRMEYCDCGGWIIALDGPGIPSGLLWDNVTAMVHSHRRTARHRLWRERCHEPSFEVPVRCGRAVDNDCG